MASLDQFLDSSHQRNWLFDETKLYHTRVRANETSRAQSEELRTANPAGAVAYLTPEEEKAVVTHLLSSLREVCVRNPQHFGRTASASALLFLNRYYVEHSVMDVEPQRILAASLMTASKVEAGKRAPISIKDLSNIVKVREAAIKLAELPFLEGIKFNLKVYLPYLPLRGFLFAMREGPAARMSEEEWEAESAAISERASHFIDKAMRTDAPLLFSPSQIALAAMQKTAGMVVAGAGAVGGAGGELLKSFLQSVFGAGTSEGEGEGDEESKRRAVLRQKVDRCVQIVDGLREVDETSWGKLERKLRACRNPLFDPTSTVFRLIKEQKREGVQRRRAEKHALAAERDAENERNFLGRSSPVRDGGDDFTIKRPKLAGTEIN